MKICFVALRIHTNMHDTIDTVISEGHDLSFITVKKSRKNQQHEVVDPFVIEHKETPKPLYKFLRKLLKFFFGYRLREPLLKFPNYNVLKKRLKEIQPDVVIIKEVSLPLCLTAFYLANKLDIEAVLYTQHPLEAKDKLHVRLLQSIGIVPERAITPSRKNQENLNISKKNLYYVPLVVENNFDIKDKQYFDNDRINILFIGKFTLERKKHLLLLKVIKRLKGHHNIHVTMIGTGSKSCEIYRDIESFIKKNNMNDVVTMKNNLPFEQMPGEYKAHDLYVLPSVNEPFSISPLEAMSYGLPAIITEANGAIGCVQDGVNGYVFEPNSEEALLESVEQMLDRDKITKMGENAFNYIKQYHSGEYFLKRLKKVDVFKDLE